MADPNSQPEIETQPPPQEQPPQPSREPIQMFLKDFLKESPDYNVVFFREENIDSSTGSSQIAKNIYNQVDRVADPLTTVAIDLPSSEIENIKSKGLGDYGNLFRALVSKGINILSLGIVNLQNPIEELKSKLGIISKALSEGEFIKLAVFSPDKEVQTPQGNFSMRGEVVKWKGEEGKVLDVDARDEEVIEDEMFLDQAA